MSGAIVPNDWDGSTYKCYQVQWPQSEQYEAILLGNISKPSFLNYWDGSSGDAQAAANAIKTAYINTLPDFWAGDCEEMPELTTKSFRVKTDTPQAIPSNTWTKVSFDEYEWNLNSPGWSMPGNAMDLTIPANAGIWQFNAEIWVDDLTELYLAVRLNNYWRIAQAKSQSTFNLDISTAWNVNATWTWLNIWIYSTVATSVRISEDFSPYLSGHLVRSIEAP